MKKFLLVLFLLLDLIVIAAASAFLYFHLQGKPLPFPAGINPLGRVTTSPPISASPVIPATPAAQSPVPLVDTSSAPAVPRSVASAIPAGYRNIRFQYKNPKAREVFIRADFTGWKGSAMKKDATGVWTYDAQLPPGEYAYCYAVDSKIIPDPASKRFKKIGQTKVSAIVVTPTPAK